MRKKIVVELRFIDIQTVSDFPHGANVERGIWISPIQLLAQVADMKTYRIILVSCSEIAPRPVRKSVRRSAHGLYWRPAAGESDILLR